MPLGRMLFTCSLTLLTSLAIQTNAQSSKPPSTAAQAKMKAIWEPINFKKDINLHDVFFTSTLEGWVVGDKNTILHTTDGGKTWEVQLGGDPEATDRGLTEVFFLNPKEGWTRGGAEKLLFTSDGGASWGELGRLSQHALSLNFINAKVGFTAQGDSILGTVDGGRTWKKVAGTAVDLEIDGLSRRAQCSVKHLSFPTTANGYASGGIYGGSNRGCILATKDGGQTWTSSAPPVFGHFVDKTSFWSAEKGLATLRDSKTLLTSDGGATWTPIVTPIGGEHALIAINGTLGVIVLGKQIAYSTNGGKSFSGRAFPTPAPPRSLHFADAAHGYIVGDHGMIYRYTVVPADFSVPGMIPAALP